MSTVTAHHKDTLHQRFLSILPRIELHARIHFTLRPSMSREREPREPPLLAWYLG